MRVLKILVAAGVVAVAGLGTSAPAMAAANPSIVSVSCKDPNVCNDAVWSAGSVTANPGDAFTVHNASTNFSLEFIIFEKPGLVPLGDVNVAPSAAASMTAPSAVGTYGLVVFRPNYGEELGDITLTVTNDPIAPAHADGSTPQPILGLQQVGVPASGDCADVPASVGHDQGFPIGGWSKSWSQWINNGTGGPVCTRTVEEIPNGPGTYRLVVNP